MKLLLVLGSLDKATSSYPFNQKSLLNSKPLNSSCLARDSNPGPYELHTRLHHGSWTTRRNFDILSIDALLSEKIKLLTVAVECHGYECFFVKP